MGAQPEAAEGEDAPAPVETFREMHRLAFTVTQIDHDVAVAPKGQMIVDATHNVVQNVSYRGLSYEAAGSLSNYYHLRTPESARAKACYEKPGIVRPSDFLDPIAEDSPAGVWSISYDASNTVATLRSFYWPGYFFFHAVDSPVCGGVYFGNGMPNADL